MLLLVVVRLLLACLETLVVPALPFPPLSLAALRRAWNEVDSFSLGISCAKFKVLDLMEITSNYHYHHQHCRKVHYILFSRFKFTCCSSSSSSHRLQHLLFLFCVQVRNSIFTICCWSAITGRIGFD